MLLHKQKHIFILMSVTSLKEAEMSYFRVIRRNGRTKVKINKSFVARMIAGEIKYINSPCPP